MRGEKFNKVILIAIIVMAGVGILFLGLAAKTKRERESQTEDVYEAVDEDSDAVYRDGIEYVYNDHLSNYLFLGVDTESENDTSTGAADAGQADALFVLSLDRMTGDVTVLSIPRDTMTDIETFDKDGNSLGTSTDHISLSYAYGDGKFESCELTKTAVENLLYGIPIQKYCALTLGGIAVIANAVGPIDVVVPDEGITNSEYEAGSTVTLTAENTEDFLRYRDTETTNSALGRSERQKAYIEALIPKLHSLSSEDSSFASDLYTELDSSSYMVTNMGSDSFVDIMEKLPSDTTEQITTIPGTGQQGSSFDEYIVDEDALQDLILQTFYEQVGDEES